MVPWRDLNRGQRGRAQVKKLPCQANFPQFDPISVAIYLFNLAGHNHTEYLRVNKLLVSNVIAQVGTNEGVLIPEDIISK